MTNKKTPLASIRARKTTKTGPKKKTQKELRAEQSDCWCGNPDP
jgi:hypothetical protein